MLKPLMLSLVLVSQRNTVLAHKLNERLNPITQCTSVVGTNVNVEDVMSVFEKQMLVIDPSMRPQGKTKMRLKSCMDQRKLPAAHYNYLKAYWAKPGISYEYSAFMDSHFDFVGFWVGECALDTLMPYWRTAAVVSESSQFTHILWAEATFEQGERMSGDYGAALLRGSNDTPLL